ncbi:hypothetical protein PVAP13_9KG445600 [Panicum virgatum]|uniref:Uncharacterized protein n=1 Tax=Panicum virgatum TaxID=38727 RepID=A0A8T0NU92_PANVG|nr:hypothetical protein PVAP13_9KG445600 [Panicum virgatum]
MRSFLTRRTHRAGPAAAMRAPRVGDSDCCTALGPGGVKPGVKSRSLAAPVPTIPLPTHPASSGRGGVPGCGWPPAAPPPPPPPLPPGGSAPLLPRIGWRGLDGFLRALVSNPSLPRTDTLVAREPVWCPARSAHFFLPLPVRRRVRVPGGTPKIQPVACMAVSAVGLGSLGGVHQRTRSILRSQWCSAVEHLGAQLR